MKIRSMVVFCGSQSGLSPAYEEQTALLGKLLAEHKIKIIYGGGNKGLMAAVANGALKAGGEVTGIMPKILSDFEHQHNGLTELMIVDTMHTRKKLLYAMSGAAIILPGGYGTLDEMFEMLTWNQLRIHEKKIFFLNINNFYDHLIAHIQKMYEEKFLYSNPAEQMTVIEKAEDMTLFLQ